MSIKKRAFTLIEVLVVVAIVVILAMIIIGSMSGCDLSGPVTPKSADKSIQLQQEKSMQEAVRQTGLPAIKNYHEKKMLKMLYELRDQADLICYAYLVNQLNGEVGQFIGKCIGYGLPASTQYSNPEKFGSIKGGQYGRNPYTMPQAEPNGLFMPEGLSATWLMMIDPATGEAEPVYLEPLIIVSPFPLHDEEAENIITEAIAEITDMEENGNIKKFLRAVE